MPANFPASPTTNQTYSYNGMNWRWDGVRWVVDLTVATAIGATGATGPQGAPGSGGTGGSVNFDGGSPSSTYTTGPVFDCGGVS